ncbi:unnamed protein product [Rotaria sordida]|uniref:SAM domain-containing protein n=1 Tax=Rotaria sordida TaxID=392033 RepID=A0A815LAD0_9BILA|nr:unnamed protein product [Rotaria sordida]CAF1058463.1 unnamed protein product [Rotaria sordida]CAF1196940.1 unnamed protein product [Rotaria sordida]CAF1401198.1 unnamed protein product [Rotaria sordida]CAF1405278.1 unnamed protein product [Rotaria sordida]
MANMVMTMADLRKLGRTEDDRALERTKTRDIESNEVSAAIYWSCDEVANFIEMLGFPQYRECFLRNKVDGRRLIWCDASHLNALGVQDFKHIISIAKSIRELLQIEKPYWNRSITLPYAEALSRYLEQRSVMGHRADELDYTTYTNDTRDAKFQPVLTNQGVLTYY